MKRALSLTDSERAVFARIAAAVAAIGSTQAAARAAGMSVRQISAYRRGESAPTLFAVMRLALAAGMSLDAIAFGGVSSPCPKREPSAKREFSALRRDNGLLKQRVEQLTTLAITLADRRAPRVSRRELARALGLQHQAVSRLLSGSANSVDLATRLALEEWLAARRECASCLRDLSSADFAAVLSRHVQPVTRAPKGSRAPKEPTPQ